RKKGLYYYKLKIERVLGRKSLITLLLTITVLGSFAQGGPSAFEFVENKGQWDSKIKFKGELPAGEFYLQPTGFTVALHNTDDLKRFFERSHGAVGDGNSNGNTTAARTNTKGYDTQNPGNGSGAAYPSY